MIFEATWLHPKRTEMKGTLVLCICGKSSKSLSKPQPKQVESCWCSPSTLAHYQILTDIWQILSNICKLLTSTCKNGPFFKRARGHFKRCSVGKKHMWCLGLQKTYTFVICNIECIIYRYYYELVYLIGIEYALYRVLYCPAYSAYSTNMQNT